MVMHDLRSAARSLRRRPGYTALAIVLLAFMPGAFVPRQEFSRPALVIAGLLVGFGTRMGNGCTSGHGVCGLGRLSPRSLAAVVTFMATAVATTYLVRHGGSGL